MVLVDLYDNASHRHIEPASDGPGAHARPADLRDGGSCHVDGIQGGYSQALIRSAGEFAPLLGVRPAMPSGMRASASSRHAAHAGHSAHTALAAAN